ncbi:hypothetical protein AWR36_006280 [Microbulbifer flavimaris]|uniref:DUF6671 domain-containing protein n=1 Tax=Microbulbifer flavimaris TaxID=1781068 RepID=A0ABX4HZQ1_9GAMM|nr:MULTISPECIES: DUF6671 family protein [Microbulbifer]KUJ83464.1 hypothetical protein AVO43_06265 [Microbulbifer sp. ZGT114]PCO05622.1 hypothetical protein AWR36_006280 [Microbulbifer flavimaris]
MSHQQPSGLSADFAVLLTQHGKESVIGPVLAEDGLLTLQHTDAFDTDTLGTFSGEIERKLSPIDCARHKARLACELSGASIGLGSEGSFGAGPLPGLVGWDHELLVLVDLERDLEIVASAQGPFEVREWEARDADELRAGLCEQDPGQGWLLQANGYLAKGLQDADALLQAAEGLYRQVRGRALINGEAFPWPLNVQPDLRAMHCPARQAFIREAAINLRQRLLSLCPDCAAPGFWPDLMDYGLPCSACGFATGCLRQRRAVCAHCKAEACYPVEEKFADPGSCQICNP